MPLVDPVRALLVPRPDDDPSVVLALQAATQSLTRDDPTAASSALRLAADAAARSGATERAVELLREATALRQRVEHVSGAPDAAKESTRSRALKPLRPPSPRRDSVPAGTLDRSPPSARSLVPSRVSPPLPPLPPTPPELSDLAALTGVPAEARAALRDCCEVVSLAPEAERTAPDLLIVLEGEVDVRVPGRTWSLETATAGATRLLRPLPPANGTFTVVGGQAGARYVAIGSAGFEILRDIAPELIEELGASGEGAHALARILGRRTDIDATFLAALGRATETRRLWPGHLVVKAGEPVRALVMVGAGELLAPQPVAAGEVLFRKELLGQLSAPTPARAGAAGALVLVARKRATEEILADPRLRTIVD
jgi:hypothetical protein